MAGLPLYREVKEKLIQALAAGEWQPGGKIPVERDLARRYRVGIATVRTAVSELETAGILSRRQGKWLDHQIARVKFLLQQLQLFLPFRFQHLLFLQRLVDADLCGRLLPMLGRRLAKRDIGRARAAPRGMLLTTK